MKQKVFLSVILLVALVLGACGLVVRNDQATAPTAPMTDPKVEIPTEPATAPQEQELTVKQHSFYVYDAPNFDGKVVQPLPVGTYTIPEEKTDEEGYTWGRLKSGLGWICLTEIRERENDPIGIGQADQALLDSGAYTKRGSDQAEFALPVVIHGVENLAELTVTSMEFSEEGMLPGLEVLREPEGLAAGKYIVAWLPFPGDFTTYEATFLDGRGQERCFQFCISGRNGTLVSWEEVR